MTVTIQHGVGGGGGALSDGDYGDITVGGGGTTMTIDANAVTNSKLDVMAANTVKANATTGSATPTDVSVGASQLVGRGSSGNIAGLSIGNSLGFLGSATTLEVALKRQTFSAASLNLTRTDDHSVVSFTGSADTTVTINAIGTGAGQIPHGWHCFVENNGTSNAIITIDPNASEQIDGATTIKMYPNEIRLVQCDGAAFYSYVIRPFAFSLAYAASPFTFTKPPGYQYFGVRLGASGGAGGKGNTAAGCGGGGGASHEALILASAVGTTETITIGAGAAGQTTTNTAGANGNNTTFGSLLTAYGGGGGGAGGSSTTGGGGGGITSAGNAGGTAPTISSFEHFANATSGTAYAGVGGLPLPGLVLETSGSAALKGGGSHCGGGAGGYSDNGTAQAHGGPSYWGGGGGGGLGTTTVQGGNGGDSVWGGGGGAGASQDSAPGPGTGGASTRGGGTGGNGGYDAVVTGVNGTAGSNGGGGGGGGGTESGTSGTGGNGSAAVWGVV